MIAHYRIFFKDTHEHPHTHVHKHTHKHTEKESNRYIIMYILKTVVDPHVNNNIIFPTYSTYCPVYSPLHGKNRRLNN